MSWSSSYLLNSIDGVKADLEYMHYGAEGSILEARFLKLYMNNLLSYCSVHHFPEETNLLNYNIKQVNQDWKKLRNWLNANKICLNISKIEVFYSNLHENKQISP